MATPRRFPATVAQIQELAEGLYTLTLAPGRKPPSFRAGQFMHLALDPYDPSEQWPESRAFSLANCPGAAGELSITYAVKGRFTSRMAKELAEGSEVWVKMPYGSFFIESSPDRETALIAGGTGITPFISFLEEVHASARPDRVRLFFGVRSGRYFTHRGIIGECASRLPGFSFCLFAEEDRDMEGLEYVPGRLDLEEIWKRLSDPEEAVYYVSGPPVMIKAFCSELARRGIPGERILTDDWE